MKFIEVNKTGEKTIINLSLIKKVVPVINGVGCIVHFEQGTLNVSESYESIRDELISGNAPKLLNEEASKKK
jgi:hypothetical protein